MYHSSGRVAAGGRGWVCRLLYNFGFWSILRIGVWFFFFGFSYEIVADLFIDSRGIFLFGCIEDKAFGEAFD